MTIFRNQGVLGLKHQVHSIKDGTLARSPNVCSLGLSDISAGFPQVRVSHDVKVHWDLGMETNSSGTVRGGGMHRPHHVKCGSNFPIKKASSKYNKVCNDADYRGTKVLFNKKPDVSIKFNNKQKIWTIQSITVYVFIEVHEPVEGAYPVFGKNVINDKKYGIRGLRGLRRKPTDDPNEKGYWKDVVENLRLYRNKFNPTKMYWWVKGSTRFHEETHYKLYRIWFEENCGNFMKIMKQKLLIMLRDGKIYPVTQENIEKKAGSILISLANDPDTEPETYEKTRLKYWEDAASAIEKQAAAAGWDR